MANVGKEGVGRRERRIARLIRTLREAEQELQSLTGGQIDGVGGADPATFLLLSSAQDQLRASESMQRAIAETQTGILDALPAHIALLDGSGTIIVVNEAWRHFASANVLQSDDFCVGQNYVEICESAEGDCAKDSLEVAKGIREVLSGVRDLFSLEYPCHSPDEQRWYRLMVTPLRTGPGSGAVVMHVNVTDRRKAEDRLKDSEERFRLMVEGSEKVLFYTHDRGHIFEYLSPSVLDVLGYTPGELEGKHCDCLVIEDDAINANVNVLTDQALRDGLPCPPYLAAVRHKNGRRIVLEILESPVLRDERVVGIQGFARDVTERVQAEADLAASEARFRSFFEQASVGMVITSEDRRFLRINQRFAEITGYLPAELLGQSCVEVTHPEERAQEAETIRQMLAGELRFGSWEKRYLRKDGSPVWCTLTLSLLDVEGESGRQFIGVVEDISSRKQSEDALRQSQNMLRIAGTVAKLGGWLIDLDPIRLRWSEIVREIHEAPPGYEPTLEEAINFYPPEYREQVSAAVDLCAQQGVPFRFEHELITMAGRRIWVLAIGEAVRDKHGRIVQVQGAFQNISERKAAEASLAESLRRFRSMADSFPFIVWTANSDGKVDYANQKMVDYTGVDPAEPPELRWQRFVHPDDIVGCLQAWEASVLSGNSFVREYRILHGETGTYRWFRVQAEPVRDADANIAKWYGTGLDIDETKRIERQASALAKRLHDTLESITDGFFILDRNWTFTFLNTQASVLLSRPAASLLGKNIWEEFPHALGSLFQENYERAMLEGRAAHFQAYYPLPLDRWHDVSAYPGEEGLAVYFRDITESRASMAQLRLLESAVARLNDIVLITEAEPFDEPGPRIVFVNEAFVQRTGYTREEVIGRSPRILQGPRTQRDELDRIRRALADWKPVRAELINYTKSGEEFWMELDIVPLADSKGGYTHWVAVARDVTERKRTAEQLRQSQRLEAVGQLTGGMAHDFNNLLTVILGNAELLHEQMPDNGQAALAEMIVAAAQRGADLTQRLLAFARRQPLDPKTVDVNRLAAEMEPLLRRTLGEHIEIELSRGGGLWNALVDPSQLENALLNLCLNARDAMATGGRLTIETANVHLGQDYADQHADVKPGQYVMLAVSDTGAGIPREILRRIFEPFFTTKPQGKGTGLGLAMVYGFIKQTGGHIAAYSEVSYGTTIKLYLPRARIGVALDVVRRPAGLLRGGSEYILLVEDDDMVRQYASGLLESLGYRVYSLSDGAQALEVLRSQQPIDLLFTDVVMPGISGSQLAEEAARLRPGLPVLYSSGYTDNAIVHHGRLDSGVHLLSKPYRREELARKIRVVLDGAG